MRGGGGEVSTTDSGACVQHGSDALPVRFKQAFPVILPGVAQLFVLRDGHIAVADLPQRAQAQVRYGSPADTQTHRASARRKAKS